MAPVMRAFVESRGWADRKVVPFQARRLAGAPHRCRFVRPRNVEVERTTQTLAWEWASARPSSSEEERAETLSSFVEHYMWDRPHGACGGLPPMPRVYSVLAAIV